MMAASEVEAANLVIPSWDRWQKCWSRANRYKGLMPETRFPGVLWCFKIFEGNTLKKKKLLKVH